MNRWLFVFRTGLSLIFCVLLGLSQVQRVAASTTVDEIPQLVLWIKADSLAESDGTQLATLENEGTGGDFTQATGAHQPRFYDSVINGLPVIRFDGTDDYMDATVTTSDQVTVFAVAANTRTTLNTVDVLVSSADAGGGSGFSLITANQWISNTQRQLLTEGSGLSASVKKNNASSPLTLAQGEFGLFEFELDNAGSRSSMRLGQFTDGNFTGQHDLAELLVFDAQLSTAEKEIVISYLEDKYDITITPSRRTLQTLTSGNERMKSAMYWPRNAVTPDWWKAYLDGDITNTEITNELLELKEELGINTIRVFVFYDIEFRKNGVVGFTDGAGNKNDAMRTKLSDFIDLADSLGLDVIPTLFQEMESDDPNDFGTGTTLADNLTYHEEYANWLGSMFETKDNIPGVIIINEPDGYGAWSDDDRAVRILTWLRAIKTELESVMPSIPIWINTTTHDNVIDTFAGAPVGSQSIYEISDAYAFNSFLWADNGYWEYAVPPITFGYALSNNPDNKPIILTEFGHPSHGDDDGLVVANQFWNNPVGSRPTTPSTQTMQKQAINEFSYWLEQLRIDGASVWSGQDHPVTVYRDPFGLLDETGAQKLAGPLFKRMFTSRFDSNGEAPLSLMQGDTSDGSSINGIDGTNDLPGGVELDAAGTYTSTVLPYKLPLGVKFTLQQGTRPIAGGPYIDFALKSAGVNKTIAVNRDEANRRWRLLIDSTLVAATTDDIDPGLTTDPFTLELRVTEDREIVVLVDDTELTLYETSGSSITSTEYTTKLAVGDIAADIILTVAASTSTGLDVIRAVATGTAEYPIVSKYENDLTDLQKLVTNVPSGFAAVRSTDASVNVASTPQWGVRSVRLQAQSDQHAVGEFSINFDQNRDWNQLTAAAETHKSVVHYPSGIRNLPGNTLSSFSLLIPKAANHTAALICPGATTLAEVVVGCANGYSVSAGDSGVSIISIGGQDYWQIAGITSTGGLSYQTTTPTPAPISSSNTPSKASSRSGVTTCRNRVPGTTPELYAALPTSATSLELYFTDAGEPYSEYHLRFRRIDQDWEYGQLHFATKGDRHKGVDNLDPSQTYVFQIQAAHGCAAGEWSNEFAASINRKHTAAPAFTTQTTPTGASAQQKIAPTKSAPSQLMEQLTKPHQVELPEPNTHNSDRQPTGWWGAVTRLFKNLF